MNQIYNKELNFISRIDDILLYKRMMTKIQLISNKTLETIVDISEILSKIKKNGCQIV